MITEFLSIIDKLIKLKEHREKRQSKRFEKIIEPAFNDLLQIHADYIRMFEKVYELLPDPQIKAKSIKSRKKLKDAEEYLSEKRRELEPLRSKVRALFAMMQSPDRKGSENDSFVFAVANYLRAGSQFGAPRGTASVGALEMIKEDPNGIREHVASLLTELRINWSLISEEYGKLRLAYAERE
jgi:hypothetical protein